MRSQVSASEPARRAPQIFWPERAALAKGKARSEDEKCGAKPTQVKTDFSVTMCIIIPLCIFAINNIFSKYRYRVGGVVVMLCRKIPFFFVFLIACNLLGAKEPNRYAVITLENQTPFRIFYSYRWGESEEASKNSIPPHGSWVHWWEFNRPNEEWAPWFYLRLDGDAGWHKLGSFYSPDTEKDHGRKYRFIDKDDNGRRKIELEERLYTE